MDYSKQEILQKVNKLMELFHAGSLGGEIMPEDANPALAKDSLENYTYFTLPMALNYQRNSYALWEGANKTYCDPETHDVFSPFDVTKMNIDVLREKLIKYKVALQPNKQPVIWQTICISINDFFAGDIRNLFSCNSYSVLNIKQFVLNNKKSFPYLSGNKIINYWLYVMQNYTDLKFVDRENITIAPDTHVIQASMKLGVITFEQSQKSDVQLLVANRWNELLLNTPYQPIDIHTPLWLWSRNKFSVNV